MDKVRAMQVFVSVAESGSFTRSAGQLGLPKATVSRLISVLENRLGSRLLQRTTRAVRLTDDGEHYYQRCLEALAMLEEMDSHFQQPMAALVGRVRVDMPVAMACNSVLPRLAEFTTQFPEVEIELCSSDGRSDIIAEGFDCVVRVGERQDSGMVLKSVGEYRMMNCASAKYLQQYGLPHALDCLSQHRLVHYQPTGSPPCTGFEVFDGVQSQCYPMQGTVTVNNTEAYREACVAGLGIIQVPTCSVPSLLASGTLVEILPAHRARPMPVSLLYPQRHHVPQRVRHFMDWLTEIIRENLSLHP